MSDLIDTTEMYLRTVFELEEEGIPALRARIAERLGHSGPTVSQTVARMERDGLLCVADDRHLELTVEGRRRATRVMRKHRLAERLLADVIGLEWQLVHDEACRWEHVISDEVERKIVELIGGLEESPYGNPIPGLDELMARSPAEPGPRTARPATTLDLVPDGGRVVVRRIGELVQVDPENLAVFRDGGIVPGATVAVERDSDEVVCRVIDAEADVTSVTVPVVLARHVYVETA